MISLPSLVYNVRAIDTTTRARLNVDHVCQIAYCLVYDTVKVSRGDVRVRNILQWVKEWDLRLNLNDVNGCRCLFRCFRSVLK